MVAVAVPSSTSNGTTLIRAARDRSYEDVLGHVAGQADLAIPDQVLPLAKLRATDEGLIEVPGIGPLALTDWSQGQLATKLGVRWGTWFNDNLVEPSEQAEEINRRLQRRGGELRIRARRWARGETPMGEGVLRALLTPGYAPIDDLLVFETLGRVLGGRLEEFRFIRADITPESSQFALVTVRETDLGVRVPDRHRSGVLIANSETGSRALTLQAWFWRLVCTNGMVVSDSRIFRMVHRRRKRQEFDAKLAEAIALLPNKWEAGTRSLREARLLPVAQPIERLRALMSQHSEVGSYADAVVSAYEAEPEPNRFGMAQAFTRAAQRFSPERRLILEEFAGRLLAGQVEMES